VNRGRSFELRPLIRERSGAAAIAPLQVVPTVGLAGMPQRVLGRMALRTPLTQRSLVAA
jgi:hypothetical protein